MERLSVQTLEKQGYTGFLQKEAPERILQFGEGNFLRGFVDYFVDIMNEKADFHTSIVVLQPTGGGKRVRTALDEQQGLYTLLIRGKEQEKKISETRVISCISRCLDPYSEYETYMACAKNPELRFIISNTTEAGICYDPSCNLEDRPASAFPGKLTQFLYARYQTFGEEQGKGFWILPCELIEENAEKLKQCVFNYAMQWELGEKFLNWLERENVFCPTLVDRIVTGYPQQEAETLWKEFGYQDQILDTVEVFASWVIEAPERLKEEIPFEKAQLPIILTGDHRPYKQRKVRILNGAHTTMVLGAYLAGKTIVRECMEDPVIRSFLETAVYKEIIPTLTLPKEELLTFADAVKDRFQNPFIDHALVSIALNSTSKWCARVLPSLKAYVECFGELPECLTASLAYYIAFYRKYGSQIKEEAFVVDFFTENQLADMDILAEKVLANTAFWGEDLTKIEGLLEKVKRDLGIVEENGACELMRQCIGK